jgi:tripartite-type tricarboxylate transporter receptor subunit TctC
MGTPAVRNVLGPDQIPTTQSPEEFTALIRKDIDTWGPVIRAARLVE